MVKCLFVSSQVLPIRKIEKDNSMTLLHAFLLGIIQGLTEFIPVSSTAHLLISQTLLKIPADRWCSRFSSLSNSGLSFPYSRFTGKIYFPLPKRHWTSEISETSEVFHSMRNSAGIYATIPALLAGYLLKDAVEALFKQPMLEASIWLFTAAVLLALAEWLTRKSWLWTRWPGWTL